MTETITLHGFAHEDWVTDTRDGSIGVVHFFVHTEEELWAAEAEGTALAEVRWRKSCVADELDVALPHIKRFL